MFKDSINFVLVLLVALLISSCASVQRGYHAYVMKGNIIEVSGDEIYLCIGKGDGAVVGQELSVYKITIEPPRAIKGASRTFNRVYTGKVKVTEVLDEHFAKAVVISGKADLNSIVELSRQ